MNVLGQAQRAFQQWLGAGPRAAPQPDAPESTLETTVNALMAQVRALLACIVDSERAHAVLKLVAPGGGAPTDRRACETRAVHLHRHGDEERRQRLLQGPLDHWLSSPHIRSSPPSILTIL